MRVCFASEQDALDPDLMSGRLPPILRQLERHFDVVRASPLSNRARYAFIPARLSAVLSGREYRSHAEPFVLRTIARQVERIACDQRADIIVAPNPRPIAYLPGDIPAVFCHDATVASLADYEFFVRASRRFLIAAHRQERLSLRTCAAAVYASRRAADSAIRDYDADPGKVHVAPFGANIEPGSRAALEAALAARSMAPLRLLFVGREWRRKGGDIVLDTARALRAGGLEAEVDLVGLPRLPVPAPPYVRDHGPLSHKRPEQKALLRRLFEDVTLVFVPSRAEAYGMTFCEAAAFGLPAITTAVGGIPEVVLDGVTGLVLPPESGPDAYAAAIAGLIADPARYTAMAWRARQEYEARLNWDVFGARLRDLLVRIVEGRAQASVA
jgi:glycosyltransferase involved in cell wall biosynthesis